MRRTAHTRAQRGEPPRERSTFVGRARELDAIGGAFADGAALVTLTGPAGVGKTRTARRFALQQEERELDVLFCDLTEARTEAHVVAVLAEALDVVLGEASSDPRTTVGRALAARGRVLVVLDNFEQLVESAATAVDAWLVAAREAQLLVTSREPLRVEGEICLEVGPLPSDDGVELFAARARAVRPAWAGSEDELRILEQLVLRLDGLPLAIELAATRSDVLSPSQMLERLDARFELLSRGPRAAVTRHSTLLGALRWSWDLLTSWEQEALAQCSVFRAGFSLDAVSAVVELPPGSPPPLDVVQALRDRSLLAVSASGDPDAPATYRLLESVRDFAASELAARGGGAACEIRHAAHFVSAAEACAGTDVRTPPPELLRRMARMREELLAITDRSTCAPEHRVRAAIALHPILRSRGPVDLHVDLLERAIERARELPEPSLEARAMLALAELRNDRGDCANARADLERVIAIARRHESPALLARALEIQTSSLRSMDRLDEALLVADEALALYGAAGNDIGEAATLGNVSAVLYQSGRLAEAHTTAERTLLVARRAGDKRLEAMALGRLAAIEHYGARGADPSALYEEAAARFREVGDRRSLCSVFVNIGTLHGDRGRHAEAALAFEEVLTVARELGDAGREATALCRLGMMDLDLGRLDEAGRRLRAALAAHEEGRDVERSRMALLGLGLLAYEKGELDEATAHFERAAGGPSDANQDKVLAAGFAGAAFADADSPDSAEALLRAARDQAGATSDWMRSILDLLDAVLDLGRARSGAIASPDDAAATIRRAEGLYDAANGSQHLLVRSARRTLARALDRARAVLAAQRPPDLEVGEEARWFVLAGKEPVQMGRRHASRLVLRRLVEQHLAAPGAGVPMEGILAAGWPGERMLHEAAQNRVRNVMRELRDLGLRDQLLTHDDGWLLSPALVVAWSRRRDP